MVGILAFAFGPDMAAVVDTEVAVDTAVALPEPLRPSAPIPERPSVPEAAFFVVGDVLF